MPQICSKLHQVLKPDFAIQMTKKRQYSSTQFFFFAQFMVRWNAKQIYKKNEMMFYPNSVRKLRRGTKFTVSALKKLSPSQSIR